MVLRLSDELLDLDRDIEVRFNGQRAFHGRVRRHLEPIVRSLRERLDPESVASATITLQAPEPEGDP